MSQGTILIGIGYAGCKVLAKAKTDLAKLYIDTDSEDIKRYGGDINQQKSAESAMRIGEKVCGKFPAMGDAGLAEKAVKESKQEILKNLEGFDRIIIVTSLGGGTSNGATRKLAKICIGFLGKKVIVVTGLPFEHEGYRKATAQQVLHSLKTICDVKYVQYDSGWVDKKMSVRDAFNICDEKILRLLDLTINA